VSSEFGDLAADDRDLNSLLEDIGEYLTEYRILLAIDNLETLSPDTVRPLLTRVGVGSKVVITSRMRLGEIELPYALTPLDSATSIALARSHAKTLNLQSIFSAKDQVLKQFCQRLYFNPLLIKWFVSSVAGGADPKNLVSHESASFQSAVTYCFENLFNRLTELERHLCQILAAARRPLLQVELYYLTQHLEREDFDVEWALRTLHQSSMLRREFTKGGDSTSIEYALSEIAGEYISRKAPPSAQLFDMVQRQLKKLRQTVEAQSVELNSYKYSIFTVHANSREEKIAGVYLSRALQALRGRKYDEARSAVSEAKRLLPGNAEAYRIGGLVESQSGEGYAALVEFDQAVELEPKSSIIRFTYAQTLLRLEDWEKALAELNSALKVDLEDDTLLTAKALALTRLGLYREASEIYEATLTRLDLRSRKWRVSTKDQAAECYRRWAEQDWRMSDRGECAKHLTQSIKILEETLSRDEYDFQLLQRFERVVDASMEFIATLKALDEAHRLVAVLAHVQDKWKSQPLRLGHLDGFQKLCKQDEQLTQAIDALGLKGSEYQNNLEQEASCDGSSEVYRGHIETLVRGTWYGFIASDNSGQRWFFHRNAMKKRETWSMAEVGQKVAFRVGHNSEGPCAVDVAILDSDP
jgi:LuxR family transcriptional regulator, glucitol operon activator